MTKTQALALGKTLLKTFIVAALGIIAMWGPEILDKTAGDWKVALAAGIAATANALYNFFDPTYTNYGVGA
jgi:hypothetical protein